LKAIRKAVTENRKRRAEARRSEPQRATAWCTRDVVTPERVTRRETLVKREFLTTVGDCVHNLDAKPVDADDQPVDERRRPDAAERDRVGLLGRDVRVTTLQKVVLTGRAVEAGAAVQCCGQTRIVDALLECCRTAGSARIDIHVEQVQALRLEQLTEITGTNRSLQTCAQADGVVVYGVVNTQQAKTALTGKVPWV